MFLKALAPATTIKEWSYSRFGVKIPKEEIEIQTLKEFFKDSPLTEEKLMSAMRGDTRVMIETNNDRDAREGRKKEIVETTIQEKKQESFVIEKKESEDVKKSNQNNKKNVTQGGFKR